MPDIVTLDRALALEVVDDLVALDRAASDEWGHAFADDVWDAAAFLSDRPGKWTYSRVALDASRRAVACWIASRAEDPRVGVYTHRITVDRGWRRQGLYTALWQSVMEAARANGEPLLSLSVSTRHPILIDFYRRKNWSRLAGEELRLYAEAKGLGGTVGEETIREATGHEKYVYVFSI